MSAAELLIVLALALNAFTFLLFGWDKGSAKRERRRVPEARLLGCMLLGGVVGGWVGMSVFRHKTRKTSFRLKALAITILWAGGLLAWGLHA